MEGLDKAKLFLKNKAKNKNKDSRDEHLVLTKKCLILKIRNYEFTKFEFSRA